MGGKKKYIEMFGSFMEPFNSKNVLSWRHLMDLVWFWQRGPAKYN